MKVMVVSAPHWVSNGGVTSTPYGFNSQTPFSLQNAIRDAVDSAITGDIEAWGNSNLRDYESRSSSVMMMEFWEQDRDEFEYRFEKINPDLLLIGAMTLSFPGAIEIAKYAKKKKGDDIFIVLGGKHVNETVFTSRKGKVLNHVGSPLQLMQEEVIPKVFDLIVSGDGEKVISAIGRVIWKLLKRKSKFLHFYKSSNKSILQEAEGNWIVGYVQNGGVVTYKNKENNLINYKALAYPVEQFEFGSGFKIFNTDYTVHMYSDGSRGCGYDCFFCSEKSTINGKLRIKDETSVNRLFQQFLKLKKLKKEKYKKKSISVFIEDSIMLAGKPTFLESFSEKCINQNIKIAFGAQFTLDTFLTLQSSLIEKLIQVGLEYVAFGVETIEDDIAKAFSKNTNKRKGWLEKTEQVVVACKKHKLKCGMFLIWGLGESQKSRKQQLFQILDWVDTYKVPIDVGLNIATQHPLQIVNDTHLDKHGYTKYNYVDWGTSKEDDYLPFFIELFGEASVKYAIGELPTIEELIELRQLYYQVKEKTYNLIENE